MYYTIMYAIDGKRPDLYVNLDKRGNEYIVIVYDNGTQSVLEDVICNEYDLAVVAFYTKVAKYKMGEIITTSFGRGDFDMDWLDLLN